MEPLMPTVSWCHHEENELTNQSAEHPTTVALQCSGGVSVVNWSGTAAEHEVTPGNTALINKKERLWRWKSLPSALVWSLLCGFGQKAKPRGDKNSAINKTFYLKSQRVCQLRQIELRGGRASGRWQRRHGWVAALPHRRRKMKRLREQRRHLSPTIAHSVFSSPLMPRAAFGCEAHLRL